MNFEVFIKDSGKVIQKGNNLISVTVLEEDFIVVTSNGLAFPYDRELYGLKLN